MPICLDFLKAAFKNTPDFLKSTFKNCLEFLKGRVKYLLNRVIKGIKFMEKIVIDGVEFVGHRIATESANILMIKAKNGFLGCGYFNIAVADKLGEHVALVTGVNNFDDMLNAEVFAVSSAATELGITEGMTGKDALLRMR